LTEAVSSFTAALAQRPGDPDLLYYLGHASGLLSKDAIDNLLATHPDSARAHQALAENYFVLRQMPQAEKEYLEALRLRPELPGLHLELGQVMPTPRNGQRRKPNFARSANCVRETLKPLIGSVRRCSSKGGRTTRFPS